MGGTVPNKSGRFITFHNPLQQHQQLYNQSGLLVSAESSYKYVIDIYLLYNPLRPSKFSLSLSFYITFKQNLPQPVMVDALTRRLKKLCGKIVIYISSAAIRSMFVRGLDGKLMGKIQLLAQPLVVTGKHA